MLDDVPADQLLSQLASPTLSTRLAAVRALGKRRSLQTVSALIRVLQQDPSEDLREAAARALGYIGGDEALSALITVLNDLDVGHEAASALGDIGEIAREPLLAALNDPDPAVRYWALCPLRWLAHTQDIDALLTAAGDADRGVRLLAVQALARFVTPELIEPLLVRLHDPDSFVRIAAVDALADVTDPRVTNAFLDGLMSEDRLVLGSFALALAGAKEQRAVEPLIGLLSSIDGDKALGSKVAAALARFGPVALDPLVRATTSADPETRIWAVRALGLLGDEAAVPILEQLQEHDRGKTSKGGLVSAAARRALRQIGKAQSRLTYSGDTSDNDEQL